MSSLKDLASVTSRLDQLSSDLHSELVEGSVDFRKMVALADDIGRHSDRLAAAFNTMAEALDKSLDGSGDDGSAGGGASSGEQETA